MGAPPQKSNCIFFKAFSYYLQELSSMTGIANAIHEAKVSPVFGPNFYSGTQPFNMRYNYWIIIIVLSVCMYVCVLFCASVHYIVFCLTIYQEPEPEPEPEPFYFWRVGAGAGAGAAGNQAAPKLWIFKQLCETAD